MVAIFTAAGPTHREQVPRCPLVRGAPLRAADGTKKASVLVAARQSETATHTAEELEESRMLNRLR